MFQAVAALISINAQQLHIWPAEIQTATHRPIPKAM